MTLGVTAHLDVVSFTAAAADPGSRRSDDRNTNGSGTSPDMEAEGSTGKKRKARRAKTACLQCRARRSKCGAEPPHPCPRCVEEDIPCHWPRYDGRTSRQRFDGGEVSTYQAGWHGDPPQTTLSVPVATHLPSQTSLEPSWEYPTDIVDTLMRSGSDPQWPPDGGALDVRLPDFEGIFGHFPAFGGETALAPDDSEGPYLGGTASWMDGIGRQAEGLTPPELSVGTSNGGALATVERDGALNRRRVTLKWRRLHGATAIVPGFRQTGLRFEAPVQSTSSRSAPSVPLSSEELFDSNGIPREDLMLHLLDLYFTHFGSQFPFLDKVQMNQTLQAGRASAFLCNAIASIAARFSTHPAVALPHLQPYAYGSIFQDKAKALVGFAMGVPSRENILAFLLLTLSAIGADSEVEVWTMCGLATRMSVDMALHLEDTPEVEGETLEDHRSDRLLFWSVIFVDYMLCFATGRRTTIRPDDITQRLPLEQDIRLSPVSTGREGDSVGFLRSPFPYVAGMLCRFGQLIDMLNVGSNRASAGTDEAIATVRAQLATQYDELPMDMLWNAASMQKHDRAGQGQIYLSLHVLNHTVQTSRHLLTPDVYSDDIVNLFAPTGHAAGPTTLSVASSAWLHSARYVGDMLVLADVINPSIYLALPLISQCFFIAGCCFVKDITSHSASPSHTSPQAPSPGYQDGASPREKQELSRALFAASARENIGIFKQGLGKQATFWANVARIGMCFDQRVRKVDEVDLVGLTHRLPTSVSLPDIELAYTASSGAVYGPAEVADGVEHDEGGGVSTTDRIPIDHILSSDHQSLPNGFQSSHLFDNLAGSAPSGTARRLSQLLRDMG